MKERRMISHVGLMRAVEQLLQWAGAEKKIEKTAKQISDDLQGIAPGMWTDKAEELLSELKISYTSSGHAGGIAATKMRRIVAQNQDTILILVEAVRELYSQLGMTLPAELPAAVVDLEPSDEQS